MNAEEVKMFSLEIIQSLKQNEMQTGVRLNEESIKLLKLRYEFLQSRVSLVSSKEELFAVLSKINRNISEGGIYPLVHIEAHGSESGIQLCNGETVGWAEFMDHLRPINVKLKNSLVVSFAMCVGVAIISELDVSSRAPFRVMVGCAREVAPINILNGFSVFYENYYPGMKILESVEQMNELIGEGTFSVVGAEWLFDKFIDLCNEPSNINYLVNDLAVAQKSKDPKLADKSVDQVKSSVEQVLNGMFAADRTKRPYFMMDDLK